MIEDNNISYDLNKALEEVLDDVTHATYLSQRTVDVDHINVSQIRHTYHMTQAEFARTFGFSVRTLQQWEQKRRIPHGSARVLLKVIAYNPKVVEQALHI